MALVVKDRVKETTTTTGTGTITLAGAASGFQSFSVIGNGNTTYYAIVGTTEWEVGLGTYTSSGTTLSRDTVLESSNGGSLVNFSAGTKDVFVTYPAERAVYLDASGDLGIGAEPQAGTILQATGATGAATDVRITNSGTAATDSVRLYLTTSTTGTTATNSQIIFGDGANVNAGAITYQHGDDSLAFRCNGVTERMRLTPLGGVSIGTTTDFGVGTLAVTGDVVFQNNIYFEMLAPTAKSAAATLTGAEVVGSYIQYTGAAATLTLPTATNLQAALPTAVAALNDLAFDFTIINTGTGTATLAVNTGITAVGALTTATNTATTFNVRKTATNTFIVYRT